MAHTLVKRMDSAHMKRMYDKALETSDADFLSPTSDITIDHVRKLNRETPTEQLLGNGLCVYW